MKTAHPIEPIYKAVEVQRRFFPTHSLQWVKKQIKKGAFGPRCYRTAQWNVPQSGIQYFMDQHAVQLIPA